jgi:hypothetical protein
VLTYRRPTLLEPRSGYSYDWQSDNSYSWYRNYDGSTDVRAMNFRTGSMWNWTIQPNGDMRGTDGDFNPWTYNAGSKTYFNYGTGEFCTGEGYARICTK